MQRNATNGSERSMDAVGAAAGRRCESPGNVGFHRQFLGVAQTYPLFVDWKSTYN